MIQKNYFSQKLHCCLLIFGLGGQHAGATSRRELAGMLGYYSIPCPKIYLPNIIYYIFKDSRHLMNSKSLTTYDFG